MTKREKFLTGKIDGCDHEYIEYNDRRRGGGEKWLACRYCNITRIPMNYDFSTWKGFGVLWNWASKQEWFGEVALALNHHEPDSEGIYHKDCMNDINMFYINPDRFATAIYDYLSEAK
jgi:hypothetical protein